MFKITKEINEIKELLKEALHYLKCEKEEEAKEDNNSIEEMLRCIIGQQCNIIKKEEFGRESFNDFVVKSGIITSFKENRTIEPDIEIKAFITGRDGSNFIFEFNEIDTFSINGNELF